ncbi:hypothetical protein TSOC_014508, partial [Tetrabaena socialis]
MFCRSEFCSIQQDTGRQFSFDAACNPDGSNAHCPNFASAKHSFFKHNCAGQHVWINAPFTQIPLWVKHYQRCKAQDQLGTSAVIITPKWDSIKHVTKGMTLLREYPKGSRLFSAPHPSGEGRYDMDGTPWPVQVWYDPPVQPKLRMSRPQARHGKQDTRASHSIVHRDFLNDGCVINASKAASVETANGERVKIASKTELLITMQKYMGTVNALVLPTLLPGINVILGMDWLKENGAILDIAALRCSLT